MEKYGDLEKGGCGFAVLGFPCNQFGHQEPGATAQEIVNGLKYVRPGNGFQPSFPLFKKGDVNGAKQNPMYTYLKEHCPLPGGVIMGNARDILWQPIRNNDLSWNFAKFLIDHSGKPVKRFLPSVSAQSLVDDIEQLMLDCTKDRSRQSNYRREDTATDFGLYYT